MKKALFGLALLFSLAALAPAATVPMGMAQVPVDDDGALTALPMTTAPSGLTGFTLTATSAWTYRAMECTTQPCNLLIWNQSSASTLLFWLDKSTSTPAFAGISRTPGSDPIILDVVRGDVLHWTWTQSWTGNGFGIERK